ncbi:MAG: hypothetical protein NC416_08125 [Eubacterium sp.]|nr:hypothetical protein [Eubacterium sp.]
MNKNQIRNEYRYNKKFRDYVDKYCMRHGMSVKEALEQRPVKQSYLYNTEV